MLGSSQRKIGDINYIVSKNESTLSAGNAIIVKEDWQAGYINKDHYG
jgi:hypothetical protein